MKRIRRTDKALFIFLLVIVLGLGAGERTLAAERIPGLDQLPSTIRARIQKDIVAFLWRLRPVLNEPAELLLLVDKEHRLDHDYKPDDLVRLGLEAENLSLRVPEQRMRKRAAHALERMAEHAAEDGVELIVSSTYRSYSRQQSLHQYWVRILGGELASALSAPPGHSQHQLGTTVDFVPIGRRFEDTEQDRWLSEHAWKHGFSLSYPKGYEEVTGYNYESWHYRYIGRAAAALEQHYFEGVQQYMLEFLNENRDELESWSGLTAWSD